MLGADESSAWELLPSGGTAGNPPLVRGGGGQSVGSREASGADEGQCSACRCGTTVNTEKERNITQPTPLVTRSKALNYKRADWEGMRAALRMVPWSLLNGLSVDEATEKFYDLLTSVVRDHIPSVTLSRRHPPWLTGTYVQP